MTGKFIGTRGETEYMSFPRIVTWGDENVKCRTPLEEY